jgi:Flp pilus assembly protein TadD
MSSRTLIARSVSIAVLASLGACASSPATPQTSAEEEAFQQAMAEAVRPATPEQIAKAERSDPLTRANFWAREHKINAADLKTTVKFMRSLRSIGSHERVLDVATKALPIHPDSYEIYLELGRSLLADGKATEASEAFVRSADLSPETDATPLAALGVTFDRLEMHDKAQQAYELALQRQPDRVSTLSNYGMSLALTGQLEQAEAQLRKAAAQPSADVRVRQNLALILGLQGRMDEMAAVDPSAPRRTIEANRTALRSMMLPSRSYEDLQAYDASAVENARPAPQAMPEVREALITEDALQEPGKAISEPLETVKLVDEGLSGEPAQKPVALRPKLRGPQDS